MPNNEKINQSEYPSQENKESQDDVVARLKQKMSQKYSVGLLEERIQTMEKVVTFTDKLKKKYPDFVSYRLYHMLVLSTPKLGVTFTHFDFPGEDSIQNFIEQL